MGTGTRDARQPRLIRWLDPHKTPVPVPGQVTVTAFVTSWCPGLSEAFEARRTATEFGDSVIFQEIDTSDPAVLHEWGIEAALYIDDECINAGQTDYPRQVTRPSSRKYSGTWKL